MRNPNLVEYCRLCESANLASVLRLSDSPICDAYTKEKGKPKIYPLELFQCNECKFVQISIVINPEVLYKDYIYETRSSMGLKDHFRDYAETIVVRNNLQNGGLIVDIGSNDGTLLKQFRNLGFRVVGVEPARKIAKDANREGIFTIADYFRDDIVSRILKENGPANVVTVNNLLANVHDLHTFAKCIDSLLAPDGILVIESSYLYYMVDNLIFDFIYHEHLSYFSINPLVRFWGRFGLELVDVHVSEAKGGLLDTFGQEKSQID